MYSFGVVLLEAITGRYPVDYARPKEEVIQNIVLFSRLRGIFGLMIQRLILKCVCVLGAYGGVVKANGSTETI